MPLENLGHGVHQQLLRRVVEGRHGDVPVGQRGLLCRAYVGPPPEKPSGCRAGHAGHAESYPRGGRPDRDAQRRAHDPRHSQNGAEGNEGKGSEPRDLGGLDLANRRADGAPDPLRLGNDLGDGLLPTVGQSGSNVGDPGVARRHHHGRRRLIGVCDGRLPQAVAGLTEGLDDGGRAGRLVQRAVDAPEGLAPNVRLTRADAHRQAPPDGVQLGLRGGDDGLGPFDGLAQLRPNGLQADAVKRRRRIDGDIPKPVAVKQDLDVGQQGVDDGFGNGVHLVEDDDHVVAPLAHGREIAFVDEMVGVLLRIEDPDEHVDLRKDLVDEDRVSDLHGIVVGQIEEHEGIEVVLAGREDRMVVDPARGADAYHVQHGVGVGVPHAGGGLFRGRAQLAGIGEVQPRYRVEERRLAASGSARQSGHCHAVAGPRAGLDGLQLLVGARRHPGVEGVASGVDRLAQLRDPLGHPPHDRLS